MRSAERVVGTLRSRGEILESVPGVAGLAGATLALFTTLEERIRELCLGLASEEWRPGAALAWSTLESADYFAAFPQWLSAASHLGDDEAALTDVAHSDRPSDAARHRLRPAEAALPPAVCYHVFEGLRGGTLPAERRITAQGTCWRHEGERRRPLERGWSFTMREVVCVGDAAAVRAFRAEAEAAAGALAAELGLAAELVEATDPFFRPTGRGRALLQQVKGLKRELMLPVGTGRRIAAASSNLHEEHFGAGFSIRQGSGTAVSSGCFAFGLERWLLAYMVAHGTDPADWPIRIRALAREVTT